MKTNNKNKLNYINNILINLNTKNISLILIPCYLILLNYYINILIALIILLLIKVKLKYNKFNKIS